MQARLADQQGLLKRRSMTHLRSLPSNFLYSRQDQMSGLRGMVTNGGEQRGICSFISHERLALELI